MQRTLREHTVTSNDLTQEPLWKGQAIEKVSLPLQIHLNMRTLQFDEQMNALYETLSFLFECYSKHSSTHIPTKVLALENLFYRPTRFPISDDTKILGSPVLTPYLARLQDFANEVDPAKLKMHVNYRSRLEPTYNLLILSLFSKDDKTALKIIKQLQTNDCVIFHEADRFVGKIWLDLLDNHDGYYKYRYDNGEKSYYRLYMDDEDNYNLRKVAEEFSYRADKFSDYIKKRNIFDMYAYGYDQHRDLPFYYSTNIIYGIGIAIVLSGRIEILAELLANESLHPMDKIYLQYILPSMISFYENTLTKLKRKNNLSGDYHNALVYLVELSAILSRGGTINDAEIYQLRHSFKEFSRSFSFLINPDEYHNAQAVRTRKFKDMKIRNIYAWEGNETKYISIGTECKLELISFNFSEVININPGHHDFEFHSQAEEVRVAKQQIDQHFRDLLLELLPMVVGFILKMPKKALPVMTSRLGDLLRATFPSEDLKGLALPLSSKEIEFFDRLYTTANKVELCPVIQVHHLWGLPGIKRRLANARFRLPDIQLRARLTEHGILVFENENISVSEKVLHEGDHDHYPKYFISDYTELKKSNFPRFQVITKAWQQMKGDLLECPSGLPDYYVPVVRLVANHLETLLHPRQVMIIRDSNRHEHFIPTASVTKEGVKGSYLYFWQSPQQEIARVQTPVIVTGGCRFGGTLVGIVKNGSRERQVVLTDPNFAFEEGDRLVNVDCTAPEHPDEILFMLMQNNLAEIYRQYANTSKAGITINYLSLGTNYITYMLRMFFSGKMDASQLLKACGIIVEREKSMCDKMQQFSEKNQFNFTLTSSLDLLGVNKLYEQYKEHPISFIERLLAKLGITMDAFMARDTSTFEDDFADRVITYLANIENHGDKAHSCVWTVIKENKDDFFKQIGLTRLKGLNILDHIAQFAVTKLKDPTQNILVALPASQQQLQLKYEEIFAEKFGPLNYLNWLDPILMHDKKYKRKIYFVDAPISTMNRLIVKVFPLLSTMIAGIALDNPRLVAESLEKIEQLLNNFHIEDKSKIQLSKLPRFWNKPVHHDLACSEHRDQKISII